MSVNVTVLMAVYNGARFVREAVESILGQTFRELELLIIDDGSTDETAAILDAVAQQDPRVRIVHQQNVGLAQSLNNGLATAVGEIIIRMDADDVALPERIERQLAYLAEHPGVAAVGSSLQYIDETGRPTHVGRYALAPDDVFNALLEGNSPMAHPSVAMRKSAVLAVGGYRPLFVHAEDFDLWQRLADRYQMANLPDVLLKYRVHGHNVSKVHHFWQALSGYSARCAAQDRRSGKADPLADAVRLSITDFDRFELPPHDRAAFLGYLTKAAVAGYEDTRDPELLEQAEQGLARLVDGGSKVRALARKVARYRWRRGEWRRAAADMAMGAGPVHRARRAVAGAARWPMAAARNRRLSASLVHGADPAHLDTPPPVRLTTGDFRLLLQEAVAHAVLPAVLRSIQPLAATTPGFEAATSDAATRLRMLTTHSMMLRGFADALLADLGGEPVTLIKGLAFARAIYPNPQLRPFTDIDLLIAPQAKPRVEEVLRARGFKFADETHDPSRREDKWLHKTNRTLLVEVHANMVHAPSLQGALTLSFDDLASVGTGKPAAGPLDEVFQVLLVGRRGHPSRRLQDVDHLPQALELVQHGSLARLLIDRNVVLSMTTQRRVYYTWRRQGFRELLKRGSIGVGPGARSTVP